jgi:hypothetical protein
MKAASPEKGLSYTEADGDGDGDDETRLEGPWMYRRGWSSSLT